MAVDGVTVLDRELDPSGTVDTVEVETFELAVPAGGHRVSLTGATGTSRQVTLEVPRRGDQ